MRVDISFRLSSDLELVHSTYKENFKFLAGAGEYTVSEDTLVDLWNNEVFVALMERLYEKRRDNENSSDLT